MLKAHFDLEILLQFWGWVRVKHPVELPIAFLIVLVHTAARGNRVWMDTPSAPKGLAFPQAHYFCGLWIKMHPS